MRNPSPYPAPTAVYHDRKEARNPCLNLHAKRYSLYKKRLSDSPESHRQTVALFKFGGLTWREDFYKSWRFFIGLTVFRWLFKIIPREFFSYLGLSKRRLKKRIAFNESWSFADSLFGGGHSVPWLFCRPTIRRKKRLVFKKCFRNDFWETIT